MPSHDSPEFCQSISLISSISVEESGELLGREVEHCGQRQQDKLVIVGGLARTPTTAEWIVVVIRDYERLLHRLGTSPRW